MNKPKKLILLGNILLALGLLLSLFSNYYNSKVMDVANLGVGVWAPDKNSPEWKRKEKLRETSDCCFYSGIILTLAGITIGTIGSLIKKE